jgi:hypothetical protein
MPSGAGLDAASVKFTARVCAKDADAVWAKTETDMTRTDTMASYELTTSDWEAWDAAGCPTEMDYDWEVTAGGTVTTPGFGTITVKWDVSR